VILVALIFVSPWVGGVLDRVFGKEGLDRRKKAVPIHVGAVRLRKGREFKRDEAGKKTVITKRMNSNSVLSFLILSSASVCTLSYSQELIGEKRDVDLSRKVVQFALNQNEPATVKIGLNGITTVQFPAKIEAIDGYGFSLQPNPESDFFQLSYHKGTNFLSLKALRPGVRANLTVVVNEKVYCLFCEEDSDPSFVVIFGAPRESTRLVASNEESGGEKVASTARLLGFLDKVKGYPTLKTVAPDSVGGLEVAEPNKTAVAGEIETVIKRVIRDDSLDAVGFEVELNNKSKSDFYFDPERFSVRVGDEKYDQSISDAGGIVPAGTSVPAFFAVTGNPNGGRNDLAVNQDFDLEIRAVDASKNPIGTADFAEPPADHFPTVAGATPAPVSPAKDSLKKIKKGTSQTDAAGTGNRGEANL
jgi:hypothetical protein